MNYVCIMRVSPDGEAEKVAYFETELEAQEHLANHPQYTEAYYAQKPDAQERDWHCDPVAGTVVEKTPQQKQDRDATLKEKQAEANTAVIFDEGNVLKAFAEVVLDEINILRAHHALVPRTAAQLKDAVKSKL